MLRDDMINNNPKRALTLLDSIENAGGLSEEERLHIVWNGKFN